MSYRPVIILLIILSVTTGVFFLASVANKYKASDIYDLNISTTENVKKEKGVEAIVSAHKLATEAGFEILEKGGTAADAAVAVAAALSVVEPWFSSVLGGGTWALYYNAQDNNITSLDGVGPTGSQATASDFSSRAGQAGIHQAIVPGAWDGWMVWLREYGKLDLGEILEPAIKIAQTGYPISDSMEFWLNRTAEDVLTRPDTAQIYAPEGELLQAGDIIYQFNMTNTFENLVTAYNEARPIGRSEAIQATRDYFYRGPIAEAIVEFSNRNNGYLTLPDFHNFSADIVDPISINYNDRIKVFQNPPNSQGITMLLALNYLKDFDFSGFNAGDPDVVHIQAEALKLAFTDRFYHVGDPARVNVPIEGLLSERHAEKQRARINMEEAIHWPILDIYESLSPEIGNTTTFHILDRYGNGAAVTTSLGAQFLVVGDTGIHINNRMRFLALNDDNPNQVTPGFKVRHTSNPYMAFKDDQLYILGGNTGADSQSQLQVQQFLNVVEFGLSAQESVAQPRFLTTAFPSTVFSYQVRNTLQIEDNFSPEAIQELERRGHNIIVGEGTWGSGNMIVVENGGQDAFTGADPRSNVSYGEKK